ncbi:hypothetical protein [Rhodanobacter lindaniclasticus]
MTEWDACYLTNPTADNARVVRGMADAAAPVPFHVRDFGTGKMLDVRTYPRASMQDTQRGVGSNPIAAFTTRWPFLLGQAQSHATNYGALACTLWGTEFDREQAAMWANYICSLNQNYLYRSPLGCCAFRNNAARGFGRALTVLLNAATHAPIEFRPMFQAVGVNEAAADGAAAWVRCTGYGHHAAGWRAGGQRQRLHVPRDQPLVDAQDSWIVVVGRRSSARSPWRFSRGSGQCRGRPPAPASWR